MLLATGLENKAISFYLGLFKKTKIIYGFGSDTVSSSFDERSITALLLPFSSLPDKMQIASGLFSASSYWTINLSYCSVCSAFELYLR